MIRLIFFTKIIAKRAYIDIFLLCAKLLLSVRKRLLEMNQIEIIKDLHFLVSILILFFFLLQNTRVAGREGPNETHCKTQLNGGFVSAIK